MNANERAALTFSNLGLKRGDISQNTLSTPQELDGFLAGELSMTPSLAFAISRSTGMSATFWMALGERERLLDNAIIPVDQTATVKRDVLRHTLRSGDSADVQMQAAIGLGNIVERDVTSGSELLRTAAHTPNAPLFRACIEALATHSRESAEAMCEAKFESGSLTIKVEALHGLYGYNPSAALRRAFNTLSHTEKADPLLVNASRAVAERYARISDEYAVRPGEERSTWEHRMLATLTAELVSGRAVYEFAQPKGYLPPITGATLGAFFEEKDPSLRQRCLLNLRRDTPRVAELAALASIDDSEPLIRRAALSVLHFIESSGTRNAIESLQRDADPSVAGAARLFAGYLIKNHGI
jgi:plasmid maintenance system antidote protein VapI